MVAGAGRRETNMTRRIKFSDLPDDMQVLISEMVSASEHSNLLPRIEEHSFVRHSLLLSSFPRMHVFTDYRDRAYALEMVGAMLPPIVVCGAKLIDGRHRVWAARKQGITKIRALDLGEVGFSYDYKPICKLMCHTAEQRCP